jgi:uncharacterized membrane protein HdeD (DUF308 family)
MLEGRMGTRISPNPDHPCLASCSDLWWCVRNSRVTLAVIIGIIGVLALIAGVIYLTTAAHSLPTFFPGYVKAADYHKHTKRGEAGIIVGILLIVIAIIVWVSGRRRRWH